MFLDEYLKRKLEESKEKWREKLENDIIWVTDLAGCPYKYELSKQYPEIAIGQFSSTQFILGQLIHSGFEGLSLFDGWEREKEVKFEMAWLRLHGSIDLYEPGTKAIIEIKSGKDVKSPPSPHHVLQVWLYRNIIGSNAEYIIYLTYGRLVEIKLEQKHYDNVLRQLKIKSYTIEPTQDNVINYATWWKNEAPSPLFHWECNYCPYAHLCPYAKKTNNGGRG